MEFKTHLTLIGFIIVVLLIAWQFMRPAQLSTETQIVTQSPYSISISRANWGLNCPQQRRKDDSQNPFADTNTNALRANNVLETVTALCNGKVQCEIPLSKDVLGDPAPECGLKVLDVEYRCFSYDRPWSANAFSGSLVIDCNNPPTAEKQ